MSEWTLDSSQSGVMLKHEAILKQLKTQKSLLIGSGAALLALLATATLLPQGAVWLERWEQQRWERRLEQESQKPSAVFPLVSSAPAARESALKEIAASKRPSLERSRARYLLAADLLEKYEGGPALLQLEDLEREYPLLAPYVLLKRGRAYQLTNEPKRARETWERLLAEYADSPAAGEALYQLGRGNPSDWERLLAQFPRHPRSLEVARQRLQANPDQLPLLRLLARETASDPQTQAIRDRLVKDYSRQLTAADWQVIADGYWEGGSYGKAAAAYAKAPATALNRYRLARGRQLDGKPQEARQAYQQAVKAFPDAPEMGLALRRLAGLSPPEQALAYLERAIAKFPQEAPEALLEKAALLESRHNPKAAAQARQVLLKRYPKSEAAAEYRWQVAQKLAAAGELVQAWQWAQPITAHNPDSSLAPKAGFWVGKWAEQLGRSQEAKTAFEHVLGRYPQSYYAWRSAVHLGLPVGDFTSVRQLSPDFERPVERPAPPAGSDTFKELYRLGQDGDAWRYFQAETASLKELSVDQQFTQALLKLSQGKYLAAIDQIWKLKEQEGVQAQHQWEQLRQSPEYWQSLFPFPFHSLIANWSQKRQLNPLLVTSLIRQESRFQPEIRSPVGATGLMQVMPETGRWVAQKIPLQDYSLTNPEDNINLGTWYLDYTHREYDNNSLLAVASYNAGPGNVAQWQKKYSLQDPDVFVEQIPFRETKGYVESVFGNYWNYLRIYNPQISRLMSNFLARQ